MSIWAEQVPEHEIVPEPDYRRVYPPPLPAEHTASHEDGVLGIFAEISASLGTLAGHAKAEQDRRDRQAQRYPRDASLYGVGTAPSSGFLTIDLGGVPQGHVWEVRRGIIGGLLVTTTAAGTGYFYACGAPPSAGQLVDCVDIFSSLPMGDTWGTHQLFLVGGEHLWAVVHGGTDGQQYAASARVEDWRAEDYFAGLVV